MCASFPNNPSKDLQEQLRRHARVTVSSDAAGRDLYAFSPEFVLRDARHLHAALHTRWSRYHRATEPEVRALGFGVDLQTLRDCHPDADRFVEVVVDVVRRV